VTEYLHESVFTWGGTPLKFGVGAVDEIGHGLAQMGAERVLIVTDPGIAASGIDSATDLYARKGVVKFWVVHEFANSVVGKHLLPKRP